MQSRNCIVLATIILAATWFANANGGEVITYHFFVPERNLLIVNGECYAGEVKLEYRSVDSTLVVNDTQIVRKPLLDKSIIERERAERLAVESVKSAVAQGADPDQIIAEMIQRESAFRVEMYRILDDEDAPVDLEQRLANLLDEFSDVVAELGIPEPGREWPSRAYYRFHWWAARVEVAEKQEHPWPSLLERWRMRLERIISHITYNDTKYRHVGVLTYTSTGYHSISIDEQYDEQFSEIIKQAMAERH